MQKTYTEKWEEIDNNQSTYRNIFSAIMKNDIKYICINDVDEKGDIYFSIKMTNLGLTAKDYKIFEKEFFSHFVIDFIGEFIVRENIELFSQKICKYDMNDYMNAIKEYGVHKRFGVKAKNGILTFQFNISLLKKILTEEIREIIG
jgi:hypothetical protein